MGPHKIRLINSVNTHRVQRNFTQATLAQLSGVSCKTINGLEANRTEPSLSVALRVAKALGTPVEELFRLT